MAVPDYSASVARLASDLDQWSPNDALRLENERLREALREVQEWLLYTLPIGTPAAALRLRTVNAALSGQAEQIIPCEGCDKAIQEHCYVSIGPEQSIWCFKCCPVGTPKPSDQRTICSLSEQESK